MSGFRRQLFQMVFGNALVSTINLLGLVLLARSLGAAVVGVYAACLIVVDVGFSLVNFGFNQAVIRHRGDDEAFRGAASCIFLQSLAAVALVIFGYALQALAGTWVFPQWSLIPLGLVALRILNVYSTLMYSADEVRLEYAPIVKAQVVAAAAANMVALALAGNTPEIGAIALFTRDATGTLLMLAIFSSRNVRSLLPAWDANAIRRVWAFARRMWLLNFLETVCHRSDALFVSQAAGPMSLGGYYTARTTCDGVGVFLIRPVQTLFFAKYCSDGDPARTGALLLKHAPAYSVVVVVIAAFAAGFAERAILGILGPSFAGLGAVVPWLIIGTACVLWYENIKVLGLATDTISAAARARAVQATVMIVACIGLVPTLGSTGAAMSFALAGLALAVSATVFTTRRT